MPVLLPWFYISKSWGSERLNDVPNNTLVGSGEAGPARLNHLILSEMDLGPSIWLSWASWGQKSYTLNNVLSDSVRLTNPYIWWTCTTSIKWKLTSVYIAFLSSEPYSDLSKKNSERWFDEWFLCRHIPQSGHRITSLPKYSCRPATTNCVTGGLWVWLCMRC